MSALTISELGQYILVKCQDRPITPMKLQKLAYYVKAWTLVAGYPLITGAKFKRWNFGPVDLTLYEKYKSYKGKPIQEKVELPQVDSDSEEIIDFILENYADYSAFDLSAMTHEERPWAETKSNRIISDEKIRKYYSKEPFAKNFNDFDPANKPFYLLKDQTWFAFTMDMSDYDKELASSMPSYAEYKKLKSQAKFDLQSLNSESAKEN